MRRSSMKARMETTHTRTGRFAAIRLARCLLAITGCALALFSVNGCGQKTLQQDASVSLMIASLPGPPKPGPSLKAKSVPIGPPAFREVGQAAGLDYHWEIPGKRPLNILQTIGNGCAFLDFDNDGNLDILLVGPRLALYRGDGKGHFTDVSSETGLDRLTGHFLGCAVGDYDND